MKKDSKTQPPIKKVKVVRRADRSEMLKSEQPKSEKQNLLDRRRFLQQEIKQIDIQLKGENVMSDQSNKHKPSMKELFDLSFKADDLTPEERKKFGQIDIAEVGAIAVGAVLKAAEEVSKMDIFQDHNLAMRRFKELTDTRVKIPADFKRPVFVPAIIDATDKEN